MARATATAPTPLVLEPLPDLEAARALWYPLAERAGHPFATWEWADAWWRHLGSGGVPATFACARGDGEPFAILALSVERRMGVRLARFAGHGPADLLGPVCDPADATDAAAALRRALEQVRPACRALLAEQVPAELGYREALGGTPISGQVCPSIAVGGRSWDEYLAQRSSNFRQQARRRPRKLAREHEVEYRLTVDPDRLQTDLDVLARLHQARWGAAGSGALRGAVLDFHRDFAAAALRRGWLRLWTMEVDGRQVAALYGLRYGGVEWYYQSGRDPAWDREAPGFILLCHSMQAAFEDGVREYNLLRGDEEYKRRFAEIEHPTETLTMGCGTLSRVAARPLGRAASLMAKARRRRASRAPGAGP